MMLWSRDSPGGGCEGARGHAREVGVFRRSLGWGLALRPFGFVSSFVVFLLPIVLAGWGEGRRELYDANAGEKGSERGEWEHGEVEL